MADRLYDIVVFGASGFTGQFVVEEIARTIEEEGNLRWAIAGRQMKKLQEVLKTASSVTGKDLSDLPIIIVDVGNEESILNMCKTTNILLNCVGPYRFYGTPVVKACIEVGTHHIDISGEPQWLEDTHVRLNKDAQDAKIYILQACGFDSIPAEMGLLYTKKQFEGRLNSVESYSSFKFGPDGGKVNIGTWLSAIHSFANYSELKSIRSMLYPLSMPKSEHVLKKRPIVFKSELLKKWCLPFVGTDLAIVRRSNYFNYHHKKELPVQFNPYSVMSGFGSLIGMLLVGFIFGILTRFNFGVSLLEKFPGFFSLGLFSSKGPTRKQVRDSWFEMIFFGEGYSNNEETTGNSLPDTKIITKVMGPDPGYITTPICMVQAAYVLLKEQDKMPQNFGVQTPGYAFSTTSLIERLQRHKITFSVVKSL